MFEKLTWDIQQFDDIQRTYPDLPEPLGFAAINVCISAASLGDWAVTAFVRRERAEGRRTTDLETKNQIYVQVPQQRMCEAIANTAKHSTLQIGRWPNGSVRLEFEEDSDSDPPAYVLRYLDKDRAGGSIALNSFHEMLQAWWVELGNLGFAHSQSRPTFEWRQRQLRAIFGDRSER